MEGDAAEGFCCLLLALGLGLDVGNGVVGLFEVELGGYGLGFFGFFAG